MKIDDALFRIVTVNNSEFPKKTATLAPGQTPNVDSYTTSGALVQVEQEVFQALKNITSDLMEGIGRQEVVDENRVTTGIAGIDPLKPLKPAGLPVPQGDILVLLVSQKGEALENPLKIIIAYKAGEPLAASIAKGEPVKNDFINAVVESAKRYTGISTANNLTPKTDGRRTTAHEDKMGYVVRFPYISLMQLEEALRSIAAGKSEKDNLWQTTPLVAPDVVETAQIAGSNVTDTLIEGIWKEGHYKEGVTPEKAGKNDIKPGGVNREGVNIESKAVDSKALLALFRSIGDEKEFFEKLSAFAVGIEKNAPQESAKTPFPAQPLHAVVIHIDPPHDDAGIIPVSPERLSAQAFQGRTGKITESVKDDIADEMVSMATTGQEMAKKPVINNSITDTPPENIPITDSANVPVDADAVLKRLTLFVDRVNLLLSEDATIEEIPVDTASGGEQESISGKLQLLRMQTRDAGMEPVVQAALKKIIFENEEFQKAQAIGLLIEKSTLLRLDKSTLEGAFASNKEEALSTLKGLGNSLYERINYFVHPYAGIYADNREVLQLRASQKDESALLLDKELNKEQGGLQKRLNELQLLIERSTLLKQWFIEDNAIKAEDGT